MKVDLSDYQIAPQQYWLNGFRVRVWRRDQQMSIATCMHRHTTSEYAEECGRRLARADIRARENALIAKINARD